MMEVFFYLTLFISSTKVILLGIHTKVPLHVLSFLLIFLNSEINHTGLDLNSYKEKIMPPIRNEDAPV